MVLGALPAVPQSDSDCSPSLYFLYRGDYERAVSALDSSSTDTSDLNTRGVALLMRGDLAQAIASFRKALELDSKFVPARFNLGVALLERNDLSAARSELQAVHSASEPLRSPAAFHLGLIEERSGNFALAAGWFEKSLVADPENADAILHLGVARESLGDLQAAGRAYRDFLRLRPGSAAGHLRFGIAALRSGRIDTAKRYLQHTIDLAPESQEAAEARTFLVMWD
jgi:Flp pilus assembly protein TadD